MLMQTPEECQFEVDRKQLDKLVQGRMMDLGNGLGLPFPVINEHLVSLTQPHACQDSVGNQQLLSTWSYPNGRFARYAIAATSEWELSLTIDSSLSEPRQFLLSAKTLDGFDGAMEVMSNVLSRIRNA